MALKRSVASPLCIAAKASGETGLLPLWGCKEEPQHPAGVVPERAKEAKVFIPPANDESSPTPYGVSVYHIGRLSFQPHTKMVSKTT